jgi:hypothetical protein
MTDEWPREQTLDPSWHEVDLRPWLVGDAVEVMPSVLRREDFAHVFYAGCVNGLHGSDTVGKSWIATVAAQQEIAIGHHVVWITFEDPNPTTIISRLRQLGVHDDDILDRFHYYGPHEQFDTAAVDMLVQLVSYFEITLVIIDSIGEAFALEGINEDKDNEVGPWLRHIARRIADAGPALVLIDHATKAQDNPLFPSGSKRKRAAITGASYLVEAPRALDREHGGRLKLTCAKDRHGHYRRGHEVATIEFHVYPDGGMTVHVWAPTPKTSSLADAAVMVAARAAIRAVKDAGEPLTQTRLIERMNVKAGTPTKRAAIEEAVAKGALRAEPGPRKSTLHHYVRDFTAKDYE